MDFKFTGDKKQDLNIKTMQNSLQGRSFKIKEGVPTAEEGSVGNIWIVKNGSVYYLYVKVSNNEWRKVNLTT